MFYKRGYLTEEQHQFILDNSYAFGVSISEKLRKSLAYKDAHFSFKKITKKDTSCYALQINDEVFNPFSFSFSSIDSRFFSKYYNIEDVSQDKMSKKITKDIERKIESIIGSDFFNVTRLNDFKGKDGRLYKFEHITNADTSILDFVVCDEIKIYDQNGGQVGFLKAKYSTEEIVSALESRNLIKNKSVTEDWLGEATVDYVKLRGRENDSSGLGLATNAYIEMAKKLKEREIIFRSSTLQSDDAINFWKKLADRFPKFIKTEKRLDEKVYILSPSPDYELSLDVKNATKRKRIRPR